jgi:hypothetical protein
MNLTMENRKPPWAVGLYVVDWAVPDREGFEKIEPQTPSFSFQAALLADAVMQPDCAAVPDSM